MSIIGQSPGGGVEKVELTAYRFGVASLGELGELEQVSSQPAQDGALPCASLANLVESRAEQRIKGRRRSKDAGDAILVDPHARRLSSLQEKRQGAGQAINDSKRREDVVDAWRQCAKGDFDKLPSGPFRILAGRTAGAENDSSFDTAGQIGRGYDPGVRLTVDDVRTGVIGKPYSCVLLARCTYERLIVDALDIAARAAVPARRQWAPRNCSPAPSSLERCE